MGQYAWLVRSTSIRQLLTAWGLSYAGDLAAFTAASVYAYHAGGAGLVAVLGLLKALPGVLLVPLVTSGSDRLRRERLLVATAVPRALLLAAAAAAMGGGGEGVLVVVFVGLEGGLASAFRQLQAALLPWLAHTPEELTGANTVTSVLQSAAMVAGPAVAACLLAVGTAQQAMLVACGFVAVAAVLLAWVRPLSAASAESPASSAPSARSAGWARQFWLDLAAGFDAGIRRRDALTLFAPAAAQSFGRGVLNVLTVAIALNLFALGSAGVGWLSAVLGAGGLLIGPLAITLVRGKRVARSFACGVAAWGVPLLLLGFARAPYWPYLMFGLIGVAGVFSDAGEYSALQQVIPSRQMGRALGVRRGALLLAMALGSAVTPLLIDAVGICGTLVATGLLLVALAAASLPRLTVIDRQIAAPGPDLDLLRRVSFFRPLPFAIVEHLAGVLRAEEFPAGDAIIGEGEPGERFYIIAAGRVLATKEGRPLREMGAGDSFGEIALLRRIPRTATVTALGPVETRVLDREEFLAAVTGNAESVQGAEEVVSVRLQAD